MTATPEKISAVELESLTQDGTPTRILVVREAGPGFAIASLTLALCGIFLGLLPIFFPISLLLGALSVTFGVMGRRWDREGRGLALGGVLLGVMSLIVGIVGGLLVSHLVSWVSDEVTSFDLDAEIQEKVDTVTADVEARVSDMTADIQGQVSAEVTEVTDVLTARIDAAFNDLHAELEDIQATLVATR